jgi:hypothetical protein
MALLAGDTEGGPHLPEYLTFTDYHGVQARSHLKKMADAFLSLALVKERLQFLRGHTRIGGKELGQGGRQTGVVLLQAVDLQAVAGGQDYGLPHPLTQLVQGKGQLLHFDSQLFPQV